jgi:FdhD protein
MLATPQDLEDFALGFSIAEGIVDHDSQVYGIELEAGPDGITAHLDIATASFVSLKEKRRNMTGRTGCGLCGTENLSQVVRQMPVLPAAHVQLEAGSIERALNDLRHHQDLQQSTGATHAAAWFDMNGGFKLLREDVGRHNALDKLIGAGLRSKRPDWQQGMLVITSRASMEMVQKAIIAGFHFLVAISAPTSLAVQIAREHGLCLIGFARPGKWTIYSHAEKMQLTERSCINS